MEKLENYKKVLSHKGIYAALPINCNPPIVIVDASAKGRQVLLIEQGRPGLMQGKGRRLALVGAYCGKEDCRGAADNAGWRRSGGGDRIVLFARLWSKRQRALKHLLSGY